MAVASDSDGLVSFASLEAVFAPPPTPLSSSTGVADDDDDAAAAAGGVGDWTADARFTFAPCVGAGVALVNEKSVVLDARRRWGNKVGVRI